MGFFFRMSKTEHTASMQSTPQRSVPRSQSVDSSGARANRQSRSDGVSQSQRTPNSEDKDVAIQQWMEYVARPHRSWDSAIREIARQEAKRQAALDDAKSVSSTVSAYSVATTATTTASTVRRKGGLVGLPQRGPVRPEKVAQPRPDLALGGMSLGGSSTMAGAFAFAPPKPETSQPSSRSSSVAGAPALRSGAARQGLAPPPSSAPLGHSCSFQPSPHHRGVAVLGASTRSTSSTSNKVAPTTTSAQGLGLVVSSTKIVGKW